MTPKPMPKDRDTILLLCSIYNRYAQGGPVALPETLQYVQPGYLYECVQKTVSSDKLTPYGKQLAQAWMDQKP